MLTDSSLSRETVEPLLRRIVNCLEDNEYEKGWSDQLRQRLDDDAAWKSHHAFIEKIILVSSLLAYLMRL